MSAENNLAPHVSQTDQPQKTRMTMQKIHTDAYNIIAGALYSFQPSMKQHNAGDWSTHIIQYSKDVNEVEIIVAGMVSYY